MAAITSAGRAVGLEPLELVADSHAAAALYERHSSSVFGYCLSRLGRREDAEDAVQTTFLHAVRGLRRGVVPATEIAWLLGIARNVCLARWESGGRRSRLESPCDPVELDRGHAAPQGRSDELIGLEDALSQLPEQQRRAVLLRDWRGLSYDEVAAQLGVSRAAVETHIFRGRRTLAELLREEPRTTRRRLRSLGDLGSLFSAVKAAFTGGAAATKIVAAAVDRRRAVGRRSGDRHVGPGRGTGPVDAPATKPAPAGLVASVAPDTGTRGAKPDPVCRLPAATEDARDALSRPGRRLPFDRGSADDGGERSGRRHSGGRRRQPTPTSSEQHGKPHATPRAARAGGCSAPGRGAAAGRDRSGGAGRRPAAAVRLPPVTVPPIAVPPVTVTVPPVTVPGRDGATRDVPLVTVTLPPIVVVPPRLLP